MMRRLRIFTWNIHHPYLGALVKTGHDFYFPVKPGQPYHYAGAPVEGRLLENVHEIPAEEAREHDYDLILIHTHHELAEERFAVLSKEQQRIPKIMMHHTPPWKHPERWLEKFYATLPEVDALVHLTEYNRRHWNEQLNPYIRRDLRQETIYHGIELDPSILWTGNRAKAVTAMNYFSQRPRDTGPRHWRNVTAHVPCDLFGADSERMGGHGLVTHEEIRRVFAKYRAYFNPTYLSSVPMAMLEAMSVGVAPVSRATTEMPNIITNGRNGFVHRRPGELVESIKRLIADRDLSHHLGAAAQQTIKERFGMVRFLKQWNDLFTEVANT